MKKRFVPFILLLLPTILWTCGGNDSSGKQANQDSTFVYENYTKAEYRIPMRDGRELHTVVYTPNDGADYPILLKRTPYDCSPYGEDGMKYPLGPNRLFMHDKFIFVYQDVRGRFMSDGTYLNMTPHQRVKLDSTYVDESSDTYDTIDWLVKHVEHNNGKVGMWGISYPGFYAAAGAIDAHPNLVCSSPQAPIADWFWDDFHHHGAFFLPHAFPFMYVFGQERDGLTQEWPDGFKFPGKDGYDFYLNDIGVLSNVNKKYYHHKIAFWDSAVAHPNYDEFWQKRNLLPHLRDIQPAMMTVGGWYDAEDLYGPLEIYKAMEENSPGADNMIVMGPWRHGGWERDSGFHHGNAYFGEQPTSIWFQENVELPWFKHHLKGTEKPDLPEALIFNTGKNEWKQFEQWPPEEKTPATLVFGIDDKLHWLTDTQIMADTISSRSFVSDPNNPVPYTEDFSNRMTKAYMTDDQRFASKRPDVLVWQTDDLPDDITLTGDLMAHLRVMTSGTSADWIVKLIDVYPDSAANHRFTEPGQEMAGYQQMVRSEVIRGRFRNSYEHPEPFVANEPTTVNLPLQDICHTFKRGHRIMIQVQSTWFPIVDRNPQKYIPNMFRVNESDYQVATHTVFTGMQGSWLECFILEE